MNHAQNKTSAITNYREALEAAFMKNYITSENLAAMAEKRDDLGLTREEAMTIQVMVLGAPIGDVVRKHAEMSSLPTGAQRRNVEQQRHMHTRKTTPAQPSVAMPQKPAPPTNEQPPADSSLGIGLGIGGAIFFIVIIVAVIGMNIAFPPSLLVSLGAGLTYVFLIKPKKK